MACRVTFVAVLVSSLAGCAESDKSASEVTPAVFMVANPATVEFSVPDMFCMEGCGATVKETLAKQPGAKDVLVDFEHKTAIVAVDREKFDSDAALAALVDKMFPNSAVKGGALAKPQVENTAVQ